jgi:hypothetical protein
VVAPRILVAAVTSQDRAVLATARTVTHTPAGVRPPQIVRMA